MTKIAMYWCITITGIIGFFWSVAVFGYFSTVHNIPFMEWLIMIMMAGFVFMVLIVRYEPKSLNSS